MAPSQKLQRILLERALCSPRDLARCRRRVRRLSCGLPAFDSVWLDALVQTKCLTSWQAREIENGNNELTIGPCTLLDRMSQGVQTQTFLARVPNSKQPVVIKRFAVEPEQKAAIVKGLTKLTGLSAKIGHPAVVIPRSVQECARSKSRRDLPARARRQPDEQAQLAVLSPFVSGLSLAQIVLRRGRLPARIVLEIARQLLDGLAVLADHRQVHGEISLHNILLTRQGQVTLVDTGLRAVIDPAVAIDGSSCPDRNDGIAPELIGTGKPPTHASDLYGLGCLLWHLLAGRAAFPSGDPLARLAAHQTQRIPDIREVAPETPSELAEVIYWLTEPDPRQRPQHARNAIVHGKHDRHPAHAEDRRRPADVRHRRPPARIVTTSRAVTGSPRPSGKRLLAEFAGGFRTGVTDLSGRRKPGLPAKAVIASCLTICLAVAALIAIDARGRGVIPASLRSLADAAWSSAENNREDQRDSESTALETFFAVPIPKPDVNGIIELDGQIPFHADRIHWSGAQLVLRGRPDSPARIIVNRVPLQIRTANLILEHVEIIAAGSPSDPRSPGVSPLRVATTLAVFESQSLSLDHCSLLSRIPSGDLLVPGFGFVWAPHNSADQLSREITINNCRLIGDRSTILCSGHLRKLDVRNTLRVGPGPAVQIDARQVKSAPRVLSFEHCTVRESGPLISLRLPNDGRIDAPLTVQSNACVFALENTHGDVKRVTPLIAFAGPAAPKGWQNALKLNARTTVMPLNAALVGRIDTRGQTAEELPAGELTSRGLLMGEFTFQGPASADPEDSLLDELRVPLRSETLPGISRGLAGKVAESGFRR